ncbi:uncharacterized protein P174DRAFT_457633 [Aspergillus novofumigatus IBT 16806]|uniref:Uncharacterized protein n=1 Tax=Aspergillus novofumigatus (strain IBT 16806) TaxID=1392255 RepID=A0A2I1CGY6_ASPN1|nr:uncharacterized protein P174DRAFT_457633 [Aspergillus novofumigatus IBT 16806]PKX96888.1 hypothetical protein P174DRAFT_457633 [Aspergillus novofumigatus IBT 16806]
MQLKWQCLMHSNSWSAGDFTISTVPVPSDDSPPQTLFPVDGDFASVSHRRRIQDATGLPLFDIARKRLGHMLKDKFDVHLCNTAGGDGRREEIVLSVRGQDICKSRTHVYYGDSVGDDLQIEGYGRDICTGEEAGVWEIEAAIIGVLLAAMLYQSSVKGKAPESFGEGDSAVGTSEKASLM